MDEEHASRSITGDIMQKFPQVVSALGVATAMDGDVNFTSSLGWWSAGWKLLIAMGAYEAMSYGKRSTGSAEGGRLAQLGSHLRGQRLATHIAEKGFAAYAIHEALGATLYRHQPVDVRSMFYTTLGMYGITLLGKIRN